MSQLAAIGSAMAIILAGVLGAAAITKLKKPSSTVEEFNAMNVPLPKVAAGAVPILELVAAALLVVRPRVGSIAAGLLLVVFTAFLVTVIRSGRSVSCGCVGGFNREPVTIVTIFRNVVLIAMATSAATVAGPPQVDLASSLSAASVLLIVAVLGHLLILRNQIGRIWSVELAGDRIDAEPNETNLSIGDRKGIAV